jgi:pilus assembly protein Flp/PilA
LCEISSSIGENKMNDLMLKMYVVSKNLMAREEGQDLVEYALVVALIAFGAVAGMNALAGGINTAFQDVSSSLLKNI